MKKKYTISIIVFMMMAFMANAYASDWVNITRVPYGVYAETKSILKKTSATYVETEFKLVTSKMKNIHIELYKDKKFITEGWILEGKGLYYIQVASSSWTKDSMVKAKYTQIKNTHFSKSQGYIGFN